MTFNQPVCNIVLFILSKIIGWGFCDIVISQSRCADVLCANMMVLLEIMHCAHTLQISECVECGSKNYPYSPHPKWKVIGNSEWEGVRGIQTKRPSMGGGGGNFIF